MKTVGKRRSVSQAEKKARIHKVFELLIDGAATTTVVKFCQDEWELSNGHSYKYIADADTLMAEALKGKREAKVNRAISVRDKLIEKLIEQGSYAAAIQGLADRDKLIGLYEQPEVDATVTIKVTQS